MLGRRLGVTSPEKRVKFLQCSPMSVTVKTFVKIGEMAAYLGISVNSLRAAAEAGEIPFYRIRKMMLFKISEVEAALSRSRIASYDEVIR